MSNLATRIVRLAESLGDEPEVEIVLRTLAGAIECEDWKAVNVLANVAQWCSKATLFDAAQEEGGADER